MNNSIIIDSYSDIDKAIKQIDRDATIALNEKKKMEVTWGTSKGMSKAQRGSLHVWCGLVAETLNDAGLPCERKSFFTNEFVELDWNIYLIKECFYKPMLEDLTGKMSTEDQTTVEPSSVAEHIYRLFAMKGVTLPEWPSKRN